MFKRNQVMITALAIMIAVAGYLNFAGTKVGEEELADVGASAGQESDMEALLELSDEDGKEDIASLDSDTEDVAAENFLNENMQTISDQDVAALTDDAADSAEEALDAEVQEGEIPGEAVYTNSGSVSSLSGARLLKEQTRAKNKETLLEIINNANIAENQKQEAVDEMIALTDLTERETAAEILLETRGYADAVVTITDESADVVVGMSVLSDAQCAQIEDIVARKTGIAAQNIVINPLSRERGAERVVPGRKSSIVTAVSNPQKKCVPNRRKYDTLILIVQICGCLHGRMEAAGLDYEDRRHPADGPDVS